jgi:hypothetical protein
MNQKTPHHPFIEENDNDQASENRLDALCMHIQSVREPILPLQLDSRNEKPG